MPSHRSDHQRAVLKITPHRVDRPYADEAHQLSILRDVGVPVPQVFVCKTGDLDSPFSYLLMEFVEGVNLSAARSACPSDEFDRASGAFGRVGLVDARAALAALHARDGDRAEAI